MKVNLKYDDAAKRTIARHKGLGQKITAQAKETLHNAIVRTQNFVVGLVSGKSLRRRKGDLARDVDIQVEKGVSESVVMRKGPSAEYQKIQEFGGMITPKNAQALTVPLPAALTGSGVIKGKYNVADLRSLNLRLIKNESTGKAVLAEIIEQKKKDKVIPIFALVRSVKIPGAHYMEDGMTLIRLELPGQLEKDIAGVISGSN